MLFRENTGTTAKSPLPNAPLTLSGQPRVHSLTQGGEGLEGDSSLQEGRQRGSHRAGRRQALNCRETPISFCLLPPRQRSVLGPLPPSSQTCQQGPSNAALFRPAASRPREASSSDLLPRHFRWAPSAPPQHLLLDTSQSTSSPLQGPGMTAPQSPVEG